MSTVVALYEPGRIWYTVVRSVHCNPFPSTNQVIPSPLRTKEGFVHCTHCGQKCPLLSHSMNQGGSGTLYTLWSEVSTVVPLYEPRRVWYTVHTVVRSVHCNPFPSTNQVGSGTLWSEVSTVIPSPLRTKEGLVHCTHCGQKCPLLSLPLYEPRRARYTVVRSINCNSFPTLQTKEGLVHCSTHCMSTVGEWVAMFLSAVTVGLKFHGPILQ